MLHYVPENERRWARFARLPESSWCLVRKAVFGLDIGLSTGQYSLQLSDKMLTCVGRRKWVGRCEVARGEIDEAIELMTKAVSAWTPMAGLARFAESDLLQSGSSLRSV